MNETIEDIVRGDVFSAVRMKLYKESQLEFVVRLVFT
jgi:hypothetical protein